MYGCFESIAGVILIPQSARLCFLAASLASVNCILTLRQYELELIS